MIVTPNVKMVTIDDLKDLEAATDEKAFYKVIQDSWDLENTTDGLYIKNIGYTAEGLSTEDLADFLGIDISAYSDDDEGCEALQNDLSDAYQMRDDEIDARVCWLARDEIISEAREVFEESHLYTKEDDAEHLRYVKPATCNEMEKAEVKTTKNALREVGYALGGLAAQAFGEGSFFTITETLDAIKLVSKYTEEVAYAAAMRFTSYSGRSFVKYADDGMPVLYMTDWGYELRGLIYSLLEDCATEYTADSLSDSDDRLTSFAVFLQSDDFERVYKESDLEKASFDENASQVLGFALDSFIKWTVEQEQDDSTLQSLKTRLAENSALAFDKDFRTSLAEELQKLLK
ncbi:hypothetical protein ACMWD3_04865 [Gardnerella swidsinskii]|uniref:hypothetical protein n=1 Tax=Gardnerella swidsinskii TaxID=2792979 RepID=UPI0039FD9192